jgi:hypothetical protein
MPNGYTNRSIEDKDLVRDIDGTVIAYKGPSFRLIFNGNNNLTNEAWDLSKLGFVVDPRRQSSDDRSLIVHGEIPDWMRQQYEKCGVIVSQTKPRGQVARCRWP